MSTPATNWSLRELVELGAKMAIGATGACFALGLLIVNIRLGKYGVYSSEFVRTEYVIVGAAFVVLVTVAAVAAHYAFVEAEGSIDLWRGSNWKRGCLRFILAFVALVAVPTYVLQILSAGRLQSVNWRAWIALLILLSVYLWLRQLRDHLSQLWKLASIPVESRDKKIILMRSEALAWAFINLLVLIGFYATFVYPDLSPVYGGGYRDPVVLVPTSRGSEVGASVGLPILPDKTIGPVELLTESDKELIVVRTGGGFFSPPNAVRLSRDLIDAIAVFKPTDAPSTTAAPAPAATAQPAGCRYLCAAQSTRYSQQPGRRAAIGVPCGTG